MNLTMCSKLCVECPFSANSLKGWLGAHTIEAVLESQLNEDLFSCHMARKDEMTADNIESGEIKICRGYIASATKSGKFFGESDINGKELKRLQEQIIKDGKENEDIILSRDEFKEHHGTIDVAKRLSISQDELLRRRGIL
ncbi:MAG: hypothetical protein JKX98_07290 [Alcanivoracaceae bacterium]|nr:hypothetical protein [Alcanivoracaceae bacterium]